MSATGLASFDTSLQAANAWLHDIMLRMGWTEREKAYHGLRTVLHTLRDRLAVDAVAHLAAQLPLIVRGVYYEGWHPAGKPLKEHRAAFLSHIADAFALDPEADPERICRAVLGTLEKHVTAGEVEKVKASLPGDLRELWP
jgi:uncharacterized protein (DUF2267 family)